MMRIMVDPSHGGYDPGASGPSGLQEKEVNLAVAQRVARLLTQIGQDVRLTRNGDEVSWPADQQQDLLARVQMSNNWPADYFISIHCNAFEEPSARGTETYCYQFGTPGEKLAKAIQTELIKATGLVNRGVKTANFYVLRETRMPAVLIELAFITNPQEEQLLGDPGFQDLCARSIATGVAAFLGIEFPAEQPSDGILINIGGEMIAGRLINDRAWGPVRDIAESLGKTVRWIEEQQMVVIE